MRPAVHRLAVLAVALSVLTAGSVYALGRPARSISHTALVLVPDEGLAQDDLPGALDGFERAGTIGTFVELIASGGVRAGAGSPPVDLTVRAVPASRVITVDAIGPRDRVRAGLAAIVGEARRRQKELGDVWKLRSLQAPDGPASAGPGTLALLAAALVFALLSGAVTQVALSRWAPRPTASGTAADELLRPAEPLRPDVPRTRDAS